MSSSPENKHFIWEQKEKSFWNFIAFTLKPILCSRHQHQPRPSEPFTLQSRSLWRGRKATSSWKRASKPTLTPATWCGLNIVNTPEATNNYPSEFNSLLLVTGFPQVLEIMTNLENHKKKIQAWKNHGIWKKTTWLIMEKPWNFV